MSLSTHVLDTARGRPAAAVAIELTLPDGTTRHAVTNEDGRARLADIFLTSSRYEWSFWEMAWRLETWPV